MNLKRFLIRGCAVMMLLAASLSAMTGCANNSGESSQNLVYSPYVPENKVDENQPGEEKKSSVGKSLQYQSKVTASLDKIVEFDKCATQMLRFYVAQFTITNTSSDPLDCSALTHFNVRVGGEDDPELSSNVSALVYSRKYYTKTGSDLKILNQAIESGQTVTGYIYFAAPAKTDSLQVVYTPYKYFNTDKLIFDVADADVTHYTEAFE